MARLEKLTTERSKVFHRIASLYVELSNMQSDSAAYADHLREIATLKGHVVKLQRRIVLSRMRKAQKYLALS